MSEVELSESPVARAYSAAGHDLPSKFHGVSPTVRSARSKHRASSRKRMIFAGAALLLLTAAGTQVAANLSYDNASTAWAQASATVDAAKDAAQTEQVAAAGLSEAASRIVVGGPALISADTLAQLQQALDHETSAADLTALLQEKPLTEPPSKPIWAWELFTDAGEIRTSAAAAHLLATDLDSAGAKLQAATAALAAHGGTALREAATHTVTVEQQHVSARTGDIIALRESAEITRAAATEFSAKAGDVFDAMTAAVAQVQLSSTQELAEKSGPLLETRLAIEEYARSISGGVLLDFDWAEIVNGHGDHGSAGGTATWNSASGGFSTITLSNSVAEMWPGDVARALVTHEVGHAIAAKCWEMFDWQDQAANESWATAWALSMGQTADGNGVSLYGYPEQSLIDTAATCR